MKNQVSPVVVVLALIAVVAVVAFFGFKTVSPTANSKDQQLTKPLTLPSSGPGSSLPAPPTAPK